MRFTFEIVRRVNQSNIYHSTSSKNILGARRIDVTRSFPEI